MTKTSSIMMDVMRLMTKTGYMSTSGSSISLTPATILREQYEADKEARMPNRRHRMPGAVVAAAFFALMAAACLGAVFVFFGQHDRMLAKTAESVFRRTAEHLNLGQDDPGTQSMIEKGVQELQDELQSICDATRIKVLVALLVILGVGTFVVGSVGILVSRKLRLLSNLNKLMEKLSTLDLSMDSEEFSRFCRGRRSSMHEIAQLQDTFDRLSKCIVLFARFVPETVVQRIVHGDRRATRLYVDRRCATIMFSDIKDYTSLSEQFAHLDPRNMLFLLTRYFTIMTHIVEAYEGTVGEILGDGLLAFWNTPESVRNHATKACAAALAQQVALKYLNQHFASMGLPQLEIRIGLHTGQVLTGNFGSLTKMKFGCMGDTVNLASRLEGLCKVYGVGIVCSGSTHESLARSQGFLCRRLDKVKVRGRDEPTEVYELIGRDETSILPAAFQEAADAADTRASTATSVQSAGCRRSARYTRGSGLAPRIQDVVVEAIGGLSALFRGVNDRPESIWEDLSTEEDDSMIVVTSSMGLEGAVRETSITAEQQARAARYEDALAALQQGAFSVAYQLASELLEETPGDLATARLRDMANEKYSEIKTMPSSSSSSSTMPSSMPSSTLSEQERQHNELIATRIDTK
jgi:class 3 adenylate cyclase